jgi:hypothetical protein
MFLFGLCAIAAIALQQMTQNELDRYRHKWWSHVCYDNAAVLVADSLCVRADTSYRVPEPPEKR